MLLSIALEDTRLHTAQCNCSGVQAGKTVKAQSNAQKGEYPEEGSEKCWSSLVCSMTAKLRKLVLSVPLHSPSDFLARLLDTKNDVSEVVIYNVAPVGL